MLVGGHYQPPNREGTLKATDVNPKGPKDPPPKKNNNVLGFRVVVNVAQYLGGYMIIRYLDP